MLLSAFRSRDLRLLGSIAGISGLAVYLLLPAGLIAFSDDFGYYRSIIETLRRNRPWTDDWLEPWSASLSILSAIAYRLTGSFQTAVQGIQVLGAAISGAAAFAILRARLIPVRRSAIVALFVLTTPFLLWQALDFTGMVVYLPCLFVAVWSAHRGRWFVFFVASAVALASRQSALAWLAIPAFQAFAEWRRSRLNRAWLGPVMAIAGVLGTFALLNATMNETRSQQLITAHLLERAEPSRALATACIGLGVWFAATGFGALTALAASHRIAFSPARLAVVLTLTTAAVTLAPHLPPVFFGHRAFDTWPGDLYRNVLLAAAVAGWTLVRFSLRREFVVAAALSLALVSLRSEVWDYYFLDIALLGFFSPSAGLVTAEAVHNPFPRRLVSFVVVVVGTLHLHFALGLKRQVDQAYAACVVTERALRNGAIGATDIGSAPFGFIGWHLHGHFLSQQGRADPDIGAFMRYLRTPPVELRASPLRFWRDSQSLRPIALPDGDRVAISEIFRVCWIWNQRWSVLRRPAGATASPPLGLDEAKFTIQRFPLNDREWREYIAAPVR